MFVVIVSISVPFYAIIYSLSISMDAGTRAYILALYSDMFPCVISPMIVLFGAPSVRRKFKNIKIGPISSETPVIDIK